MIAILRLEAIGDNFAASRAGFQHRLRVIGRIPREMRAQAIDPKRPWVAEVLPGNGRRFLRGRRDYSEAQGEVGERGVFVEYVLEEGRVYHVQELKGWTEIRRYFCRVVNGKIEEVT